MPRIYKEDYYKPEEFMEHKGLVIYHTYGNDEDVILEDDLETSILEFTIYPDNRGPRSEWQEGKGYVFNLQEFVSENLYELDKKMHPDQFDKIRKELIIDILEKEPGLILKEELREKNPVAAEIWREGTGGIDYSSQDPLPFE